MWWTSSLILVLCCIVSADVEEAEETQKGNDREMKEYDSGGWRLVDQYAVHDTSGWVPSGQTSLEGQVPIRRRIRKRKRRPQVISLTDSTSEESGDHLVRRRLRPHRLDQLREPWEEVSDEFIRKSNNRRKIIPIYREDASATSSLEGVVQHQSIGASITFEEADETKSQSEEAETLKATLEKIRDPFTALEEAEQKQKPIPKDAKVETPSQESTLSTTTQNLKNLLKQTNGEMSLSEILQQKNLSLSELLMGNKKALSALTAKVSNEPTSTESDAEATKYKRLPPSTGVRKNMNRIFQDEHDSNEALTSKETLEAQRRRLALLHAHRDNKLYSEVTKYEVVTEAMTERRIFVPSNSKYYTSRDYVPEFLKPSDTEDVNDKVDDSEITAPSTNRKIMTQKLFRPQSTTTKKSLIPKSIANLPITSAKLNKGKHNTLANVYSSRKTTSIPEKAIKINLNEIFGFETEKTPNQNQAKNNESELQPTQNSMTPTKHVTVKKDEPLKMTIDLAAMKVERTTAKVDFPVIITSELEQVPIKIKANPPVASTEISFTEKIKQVTAKEEILELLKDPISRERLSRILEMRNMTVEELVEQRERGSSQLHLADIFHNKTREPEPQGEPFIGHISSTHLKRFPKYGRQQKSRVMPMEGDEPAKTNEATKGQNLSTLNKHSVAIDRETDASIIDSKQKVEAETPRNQYTITSFPTYKIESDKRPLNEQPQPFLPIWKGLYPDFFSGVHQSDDKTRLNSTKSAIITNDFIDLQRLEEVDNKLLSKIKSEKFNVDVAQESFRDSSEDDQDFISLPSGVKSAIIASLVIIGLSLLVFLTILVVFKYSQKQKQRLCYRNSFSGSRIKSPILETEQHKRNLRTFMTETLGRKKNYYQSQAQSMSDNIWESDKNPF